MLVISTLGTNNKKKLLSDIYSNKILGMVLPYLCQSLQFILELDPQWLKMIAVVVQITGLNWFKLVIYQFKVNFRNG
jgi:hypothetical protein